MIRISRVMLLQAAVILAVVIAMSRLSESCAPCQTPDTESTGAVGDAVPGANNYIYEMFDQSDSLSTASQTLFSGMALTEAVGQPGTNSCYWSGSLYEESAPTVSGGAWMMGSNNTWGPDDVGLSSAELDELVNSGASHGVLFPCTMTMYQQMEAQCSTTGPLEPFWVDAWTDASGRHLDSNKLTVTISINPRTITSCRDPGSNPADQDCATFPY